MAVELPTNVALILRPVGGMSQTDVLTLFGIHSTKYDEFLFCTICICSSTCARRLPPRQPLCALRALPACKSVCYPHASKLLTPSCSIHLDRTPPAGSPPQAPSRAHAPVLLPRCRPPAHHRGAAARGARLLGGHAAAEERGGGQVAAVAGVGRAHHVLGVPHLLRQLRHGRRAVQLAAAAGQRREADHEEVQPRERDQVHRQLAQVRVQLACAAPRGCRSGARGPRWRCAHRRRRSHAPCPLILQPLAYFSSEDGNVLLARMSGGCQHMLAQAACQPWHAGHG
jgi:hypothetical protein